jgi:hypothetical protein
MAFGRQAFYYIGYLKLFKRTNLEHPLFNKKLKHPVIKKSNLEHPAIHKKTLNLESMRNILNFDTHIANDPILRAFLEERSKQAFSGLI